MKDLHRDIDINFQLNYLFNSNLQDRIKIKAINLIAKNVDLKRGNNSYSEYKETIDKLKLLEEDISNININNEILEMIIYNIISRHCLTNEQLESSLFYKIFEDNFFRDQLKLIENPQSGIIYFLKGLTFEINELYQLIDDKKYYLGLKKHQDIINFCVYHGINKNLINDENEENLKVILDKHFNECDKLNNPYHFKNHIKDRFINEFKKYDESDYKFLITFTLEGFYVQKILYKKMLEHYNQTKCLTYVYNRDINIYKINDLTVVAYRYDDIPKMILKSGDLELNWKDRDFWAVIFNKDTEFMPADKDNYIILNEEQFASYKVISKTLINEAFYKLGNKVIFVPEDCIDEAVNLFLTKNDIQRMDLFTGSEYTSLGFDFSSNNSNLMTGDYIFFFKNPAFIDDLEVEKIEDYKYLDLIKKKETQKSRNKSISSIIAAAKKNPKKFEEDKSKKKIYQPKTKYPKKYWTPYKDD